MRRILRIWHSCAFRFRRKQKISKAEADSVTEEADSTESVSKIESGTVVSDEPCLFSYLCFMPPLPKPKRKGLGADSGAEPESLSPESVQADSLNGEEPVSNS